MRIQRISLLLPGAITGLASVLLIQWSDLFLIFGVGLMLFAGVLGAIAINIECSSLKKISVWRYLAAALLSVATYCVAFMTVLLFLFLSLNRSPGLYGYPLGVWLGLIVAGLVCAAGFAAVGALLIKAWRPSLLRSLVVGSLVTVVATFIVNAVFANNNNNKVFFGAVFIISHALIGWLIASEMRSNLAALPDNAP